MAKNTEINPAEKETDSGLLAMAVKLTPLPGHDQMAKKGEEALTVALTIIRSPALNLRFTPLNETDGRGWEKITMNTEELEKVPSNSDNTVTVKLYVVSAKRVLGKKVSTAFVGRLNLQGLPYSGAVTKQLQEYVRLDDVG